MARISTTLFIFLLLTNGAVTIMSASGMNEDLGVTLAPGISESMDNALANLQKGFSPSAGIGETLFTLFVTAIQIFGIVIDAVTATPQMFINIGFPEKMVGALFAPIYAISIFEVVHIGTGRRMI